MKRTAEIVLTVIGIVGYLLVAAIGGLLASLKSNAELEEIIATEVELVDPTIDPAGVLDVIGAGGITLLVISLICAVFGIFAAIMFKKNAYPKTMGIIMIILAVVCALVTFGLGIIAGLFYVIAGIVALVKRAPKNTYDNNTDTMA